MLLRVRLLALSFFAALLTQCVTDGKDAEPDDRAVLQNGDRPLQQTAGKQLGAEFPIECVGPTGTGRNAIFLHGILPERVARETLGTYRKKLQVLAEATGYRIAMPRSRLVCRGMGNSTCWNGEAPESIARTYAAILKSAAHCFPLEDGFGLIGFSNGGYHAGRVAMRCGEPKPRWILAMGSAGDPSLSLSNDLSHCAPLTLAIGTKDITRAKAKLFGESLRRRKLSVAYETFPGGHEVPYEWLEKFLRLKSP